MPATRSNLLRLRSEMAFAGEGLALLEQKKEILVRQISSLAVRAERVRREMNQRLAAAYEHLHLAMITHGEATVAAAGLGLQAGEEVFVRERSLMGVVLPLVRIRLPRLRPGYGPFGTGQTIDATALAIHRAMELAGELAEMEVGIQRLMGELRKTLKRINVLSQIYVPRYQQTIAAIEISLEEREREDLFRLKRIAGQREKGRSIDG